MQLELQVNEASADIIAKGFDAGIGPQDRVSADLTAVRVKGPMKAAVVGSAAVDGLGIAYTIEAVAEPFLRSRQLVRVLEEWTPSFAGLWMYYPGHRQRPAALRALVREGGDVSRGGGLRTHSQGDRPT